MTLKKGEGAAPESDGLTEKRALALRVALVVAWVATLASSWALWQVRGPGGPPALPALGFLPAVNTGPWLLAALALVLARPRVGLPVFTAALALAVLMDQSRLLPHVVSLALLLWGTHPSPGARSIARVHLATLWLWAGAHKLASSTFLHETGAWALEGVWPRMPGLVRRYCGYVFALGETLVGLLVLPTRTRTLGAVAAVLLHATILATLSPLGHNVNRGIWAWNAAILVAAPAYLLTWRASLRALWGAATWRVRMAVALMTLGPAGYYAGLVDAYLAHQLYTENVPSSQWCDADGTCVASPELDRTLDAYGVALPPEPRLYRAWFAQRCVPGQRLIITAHGAHWLRGPAIETVPCSATDVRRDEGR